MAQLSKYQVPNILSALRIPIGIAVYAAAMRASWEIAFGLLLLGVATDIFDGAIARRWGLVSGTGDTYEKWGDSVLLWGALIGLVRNRPVPTWALILGGVIFGLCWVISNISVNGPLYKRFGIWFTPLFYLAITWVLVLIYGYIALPDIHEIAFLRADLAVTLVLIWFKRGRIGYWFDRILQRPIHLPRSDSP